jgi:Holliday junction resolvase
MTPEGKVKERAKRILDSIGAYYFMPATGGYGRSGIPDIVGCLNGVFFAIECKANGGRPTALQLREIDRINVAGGFAIVVDEENVSLLESLSKLVGERQL